MIIAFTEDFFSAVVPSLPFLPIAICRTHVIILNRIQFFYYSSWLFRIMLILDIHPQTEPYIVKSHDIHIDADYADWIADIKSRYRSAQVKAAVKVNAEKLLFNWQLGRDLVQKKAEGRWGAGVVEQVSLDLKREFPNAQVFSTSNLY